MNTLCAFLIFVAFAFPMVVGAWPAIGVSLALVHLERRIRKEMRGKQIAPVRTAPAPLIAFGQV